MTDNSLMLEILKDVQLRLGRMEAKFDQVDERFNRMDERFDRVDERFDVVDMELAVIKADVSSLNRAFIRLDNRVDEQNKALSARVFALEDH